MNRLRTAWAALETFCATPACTQELRAALGFVLDGLKSFDEQAATGTTLDAAFGLDRRRGGLSWVKAQGLADRDRALQAIRARHLGHLDAAAAVEAISTELQALGRRQDLSKDALAGDLARADTSARIPRSRKQLAKILAGNPMRD